MGSSGTSFFEYVLIVYAIVLVAAWAVATFLFLDKVRHFRNALRTIESELEASSRPGTLDVGTIEKLDRLFRHDGGMHHYFQIYRRKFVSHYIESEASFRSGCQAEQCFDKDSIFRNTLILKFYRLLPLLIVALGVFGVVVGASAALYSAQGIKWTASMKTWNSVFPDVMATAAKATIPLAISLLGAVVFKLLLERRVNTCSQVYYRIVNLLDEVYPPITVEQLSALSLAEQKKQGALLEYFTQRYFGELARVVESAVGKSVVRLETAFETMRASLKDLASTMQEELGRQTQYSEKLLESSQRQSDYLARQVDSTAGIKEATLLVAKRVKEFQDEATSSGKIHFENLYHTVQDLGRKVENSPEVFAGVIGKHVDALLKTLHGTSEELELSLKHIHSEMRVAVDQIQSSLQENSQTSALAVEKLKSHLLDVHDAMQAIGSELKGENAYLVEILRRAIDTAEQALTHRLDDIHEKQNADGNKTRAVIGDSRKTLVDLVAQVNQVANFLETLPLSTVEIVHVPRNLRGSKVAEPVESGSAELKAAKTRIKPRDAS